MTKSVMPAGYTNVSFRLPISIVAELDALAEQTPGFTVFRPLNRSDVIRAAIDKYLRAERRK